MVERIDWTHRAQRERKKILRYWVKRNKSTEYSTKLNGIFKSWVLLLSKRPEIGRKTDVENVRVKVVRDYLIFYEVIDDTLYVLSIWDARQDPDTLEIKSAQR